MNPPQINIGQLQQEIDALALISENPAPVVTRVLFSAFPAYGLEPPERLLRSGGIAIMGGEQKRRPAAAHGGDLPHGER